MKYLVIGADGPGFASTEEAVQVLENVVIPSLEILTELETEGRILGGGLPVGDRTVAFIVEAHSNEEVDQLLRKMPIWGSLNWEVSALQTFGGRAALERDCIQELQAATG